MYSMKLYSAIVLVWASLAAVYSDSAAPALSSYFSLCHRSDPNIAECLKTSLTNAAAAVVKGVPALGLPSLEPLNVPSIEMKDKYGLLSFQQTLTDLNIYGMTKYVVKSVKVDLANNKFQLVINSPSIELSGKYDMNVKILLLPVTGSGDCKMSFTYVTYVDANVESTIDVEIEKYTSGDNTYYRIKTLNWDIQPDTATFSFSSLGDVVNKFVNSNWKLAFNIYKQIPEEAFSNLIKDQVNTVLSKYPTDQLFPA